jgi:hypothetical protein
MLCEMLELSSAIEEQAAERLTQNIDWGGGGGETVMSMMGYDPNDEENEELDTESPEFQAELMEWARDRVNNAYYNIEYHFRGDIIHVYRMITAPPDWKPDPNRHPGDYWAWGEDCAEAHWGSFGNGHVKWMMEADVHTSQIDWVQTLAVNGTPDSEDECEITLFHGSPVTLSNYKRVK